MLPELEFEMPFFTAVDDDIEFGDSSRDPLGLLPIWSTVGHALIPGLASAVSSVDGIQGLLFIYGCRDKLSQDGKLNVSDDRLFRFLERLWEYHLFRSERTPCFGANSLGAADFQLSASRSGVVGTGLRQYYRGTCVNKKIVSADLKSLNGQYHRIVQDLLDNSIVKWINKKLPLLDDISAHMAYESLFGGLQRFSSGNTALWLELEKDFIDDAGQRNWIEHVVHLNGFRAMNTAEQVLAVKSFAIKSKDDLLRKRCQHILDCEPFIQLLQSAFSIVQKEDQISIAKLAQKLSENRPDDLQVVCKNFKLINLPFRRFEKLVKLADLLIGNELSLFLEDLLVDYYGKICKERGKNPIVLVERPNILALKPSGQSDSWQDATKPKKWRNKYFLEAQFSLYKDLMGRKEGTRV